MGWSELGAVATVDASARTTVNWKKPSQKKAYPKFKNGDWLIVNIKKQRVYVARKKQKRALYTMVCSTGINNSTPRGTYHIQNRGTSFYNASSKEGAKYWTSWLYNGIYLFHTVPTNKRDQYIKSEAAKLGKPVSHGCIRLTIPDAYWIYKNVPRGTKVYIH
ncbi:L,D-transpeptidase [Lentilactobacillus senioris]|uniref:L,D-transpeptidase n=1 Tax=Lentilactobacillus senioris TaxID=931534 RepID=UPI0022822CF9|nr:L,D-transpeptidase [Lentilactobacillus senioris]MCY9806304.1 L,D-transpeptidase [Lentilactobacillus senioris]